MKIILTTVESREDAERLSGVLLEERLAGCVSLVPISSAYWWEGKIERSEEILLIIKTRGDLAFKAAQRIREIHPYKVAEIAVLNVERSNEKYEKWLNEVTGGKNI